MALIVLGARSVENFGGGPEGYGPDTSLTDRTEEIPDTRIDLTEDIPDSGRHALEGDCRREGESEVLAGVGATLGRGRGSDELRGAVSGVRGEPPGRLRLAQSLSRGWQRRACRRGALATSAYDADEGRRRARGLPREAAKGASDVGAEEAQRVVTHQP